MTTERRTPKGYTTHKTTFEGKTETLLRKARRADKYRGF